jgi:hypothetical protein
MKANASKYIEGAVSSMLICVMLAMRKLSRELKSLKKIPSHLSKMLVLKG